MADEEMFEAKFQWLLLRARGDDQTSRSFRHQLNLIKAARASGHFGLDKLRTKRMRSKGRVRRTVAHRMHSEIMNLFRIF
jgi:hypothetical protein